MSKRLTPSNLREERAKHRARRKEVQNPPKPFKIIKLESPAAGIPYNTGAQFKDWTTLNNLKTQRKEGLFEQPYRPPSYLVPKTHSTKSSKSRSLPSRTSVFPFPVEKSTSPQKQSSSAQTSKSTHSAPNQGFGNSQFKILDSFPTETEIPIFEKSIDKSSKPNKGKKLRTKWHCSICSLRHLSSEKQLIAHQGSLRCQARLNRNNPFRCRKCGKKCGNVVNYHRHKEARCYRNPSQ